MLGTILATARDSTGLDRELFARLVDIDEGRLTAIEQGTSEPTPDEVDRWAMILGLRVRDLLAGKAQHAPMALLFRSASKEGRPSLDEMYVTGAHKTLGCFLRVARDVDELEQLLGKPPQDLLRIPASPSEPGTFPAERDARQVREALHLGIEPIASMRAFLSEDLDIRLFFVRDDVLDSSIDGAVTHKPRRAILVNASSWWRTRMTLAHEFAHLLFNDSREVLLSPHHPLRTRRIKQSWQLFSGFDDIEVRADAFAACFLAPQEGVRKLVGTLDPGSEAAIGLVGKHFGVGRTVAINRLQHVFNLPQEIRIRMETRDGVPYDADFGDDEIKHADTGLRGGELLSLVAQALTERRIGKTRAWEYLGVPLNETIPGLGEKLGHPPQSPERWIALKAQRHLTEKHPGRSLHVVGVSPDGASWQVQVGEGGIGEPQLGSAGQLLLDQDGRIAVEQLIPVGPPRE